MTENAPVQSGNLTLGRNQVHCLRIGHGSRLLIAFAGFGNDAAVFHVLAPFIRDAYTLIAIDLPGQGKTAWKDKYLKPEQLMSVIQSIKLDFGIEKIALIGHSLGARVALQIAELQPAWIEQIVLLAPDGLRRNGWYHFATRNVIGKWLFQRVLSRPDKWLPLFTFLNRLKLVDKSRLKFAEQKLTDKNAGSGIAYMWPVMSRLTPSPARVKWNLNRYAIPTDIFMGRYDRIFQVKEGEAFKKNLEHAQLHLLDCGHHMLKPAFIPEIVGSLLHSS